MPESHYEILGVTSKSTDAEIKKAYRVLSLKYHPDRNSSSEAVDKMHKINEAYEVLSDPVKKRQYDMELKNPFLSGLGGMPGGMGMPFSRMDSMDDMGGMNDIFQMLFGGGGGIHGMPEVHIFHGGMPGMGMSGLPPGFLGNLGGPRMRGFQQKPPALVKTVQITLEQAYHGCTLPVEIERWTMIGELKVQEEETIYLTIPAGTDDNEMITVEGKGNVANEQQKGDVKITIEVVNNTVFRRKGLDLIFRKGISLKESLCGFSFELPHLNGKILNLNNRNNATIIKPNFKKVIAGLGMKRDDAMGNMVIEFEVEFPDYLTPEQIAGISQILHA